MAPIARAQAHSELSEHANQLALALAHVDAATRAAWSTGQPGDALANAVPYMQAFGHTVLAWIWLDVAVAALSRDASESGLSSRASVMTTRYFFEYELPKIGAWLKVVESRDMTCANFPQEAF